MCASYGTRWRAREDRSPRATPRRPLRSLYRSARRTSSSLGCHCSWFSLALHLSFDTRFVSAGALLSSLPALCYRPCRRFLSAFRLAGSRVLHLSLLSTLLPSVSFLPRLRLSLVACPSTSPIYIYTSKCTK